MTKQEIFDQVAEHLLRQNRRSMDKNQGCVYRGEDNLKCAIGALINDDEYDRSIEGVSIDSLIDGSNTRAGKCCVPEAILTKIRAKFPASLAPMLASLQVIHDEAPTEMWPELLTHFAEMRQLDGSVVDRIQVELGRAIYE